jgi:hypothetical protein
VNYQQAQLLNTLSEQVRALTARIAELEKQLAELKGTTCQK